MIKELQAECVKVRKEQDAARKKESASLLAAAPLASPSSLSLLLPPPFDPERDGGPLGIATALLAALLGWSLSLSPRYTPLAALWSVVAAAAAVDASLHAAEPVLRGGKWIATRWLKEVAEGEEAGGGFGGGGV